MIGDFNTDQNSLWLGFTQQFALNFPIQNRDYDGYIDIIHIWNRALTETEVQQYMECHPNGDETNLIGLWTFEEMMENQTADLSNNQNNGSLFNPTWSDLVPPQKSLPIPSLSQWSNIALGMLSVIFGVVTLKYSSRSRLQGK